MSIAAPFLVLLVLGGVAAYHRMRLAPWVAMSAAGLVVCWLLGASPTATVLAGLIAPRQPGPDRPPRLRTGSPEALAAGRGLGQRVFAHLVERRRIARTVGQLKGLSDRMLPTSVSNRATSSGWRATVATATRVRFVAARAREACTAAVPCRGRSRAVASLV